MTITLRNNREDDLYNVGTDTKKNMVSTFVI